MAEQREYVTSLEDEKSQLMTQVTQLTEIGQQLDSQVKQLQVRYHCVN